MAGLAIAVIRRPPVAIAGILCTYALEQWAQAKIPFFTTHNQLTNVSTGLVLLLALAICVFKRRAVFRDYPPVGWVIAGLFTFALVSVVWSVYRPGTIAQWWKHWPYIVTVMVLCPLVITEPRDLRTGLFAMLPLGTIIALLLLTTQTLGRKIVFDGEVTGLATKVTGNPLAVASFAGYVTLITVLMNFEGLSRFWQIARWGIAFVGFMLVVRSSSRGQLAGVCLALLVFLPMSRKFASMKGFVSTIFAIGIILGIVAWAVSDRLGAERWQVDNITDAYAGGRLMTSLTLLSHWAESPVHWLVGLGNSASFDPNINGQYPHVVAAEVLGEEGIIGFILLLTVFVLAAKAIFRGYQVVAEFDDARGVLATIGAMFFFEFLLSFKQGSLLGSPYVFAFAIMVGKLEVYLTRWDREQSPSSYHPPPTTEGHGPPPRRTPLPPDPAPVSRSELTSFKPSSVRVNQGP